MIQMRRAWLIDWFVRLQRCRIDLPLQRLSVKVLACLEDLKISFWIFVKRWRFNLGFITFYRVFETSCSLAGTVDRSSPSGLTPASHGRTWGITRYLLDSNLESRLHLTGDGRPLAVERLRVTRATVSFLDVDFCTVHGWSIASGGRTWVIRALLTVV